MSNRRILLGCLVWMGVGVMGCTAVSSPTPTTTPNFSATATPPNHP
ncbi:MAG: hypothetical protein IPF56_00290 [Chloroflexi bacterium]|nr:hypothetical protein [Chloroflexota bacterium]